MIDRVALLKDAKQQVKVLEKDLRAQVDAVPEVGTRLRAEWQRARKVGRTAATEESWLGERVTQAAVAWVLGTIFVRFCEDNGLTGEPHLAGPGARLTLAEERLNEFYVQHPELTARDWLLAAFGEISKVPVGAGLFDERHNALFQIPLTHDAAKDLITFWRTRQSGVLVHDFTDPDWDTRFLGDLYQDLSEDIRKKYALLQTPEFVEEFILDLTLTPALREFGQEVEDLLQFKLIDPTCGSGHFLLGAFRRLLVEWEAKAPEKDIFERISLALHAVHGVDINPYAAAIARFRLIVAALRIARLTTLDAAASYTFPLHVAVGDSLIKHRQLELFSEDRYDFADFSYATEDIVDHQGILEDGRYHVVVGNPPYIAVQDSASRKNYRELYSACFGKYTLAVPFAQLFFDLAKAADLDGRSAGHVGQITANAFMKREFGKTLIEDFFARSVELTHILDTSGARIPGHGTDTVILVGRRSRWNRSQSIRVALSGRSEPSVLEDPSNGIVWRSLVDQINDPGSSNQWINVVDLPRTNFLKYPWSLSGGGAVEAKEVIDRTPDQVSTIKDIVRSTGISAVAGEDEVFVLESVKLAERLGINMARDLVVGSVVRDYQNVPHRWAVWPYLDDFSLRPLNSAELKHLWPYMHVLSNRRRFGIPILERGMKWYEWQEVYPDKLRTRPTITWGEISSHNNFFIDWSNSVFSRTAPVVKFAAHAHADLIHGTFGILNSSTACFWLKQVAPPKGGSGIGRGIQDERWEQRYVFNSANVDRLPLPDEYPSVIAREIDALARDLTSNSPVEITAGHEPPTRSRLAGAKVAWTSTRVRMIALQEELDWQVYRQYGLLADELTLPMAYVPEIKLGERAFEIVLARKIARGGETSEWFARHGSTPITEVPAHWPAEYRALVEKRISVIESDRNIGLIERPEYKRRWATQGWEKLQDAALRDWLLDRLENRDLWFADVDGMVQPRLWTTGQLGDELAGDADFVSVAEIYRPGEELAKVVAALVDDEHVPFLSALRYADTGLVKRADWESVWEQQRAEDAAPTPEKAKEIRDAIPVPPKYAPKDFRKTSFWRARGKLDVPKERFISYQPAGRDNDPTLLIGWAGFDHREQAQALATLIVNRRDDDGWDETRLTPLVAGLREVMPWVRQWHNEVDPLYDGSPAEYYDAFLADTMTQLNLTEDALATWRPPSTKKKASK